MTTHTPHSSDQELWRNVRVGDTSAFEEVVARHQAAVSAVSYSCIGDFTASEDISQETFFVAWNDRSALADPGRLRAWLCGIARNLARNYVRRASQRQVLASKHAEQLNRTLDVHENEVETRAMTSEEEAIVWSSLETISETYREPLVLFYREGQSVASIANALDITEGTAKQRLSRGRNLLRDSVASVVGNVLEKSRPGRKFTAAVMASIGTATLTKQAVAGSAMLASAGTATKATAAIGSGVVGGGLLGALGGLLGAGGGLAGGWLGTWLPAQLAPTTKERELLERYGKFTLVAGVIFTLMTLLETVLFFLPRGWMFAVPLMVISTIVFGVLTIVMSVSLQRRIKPLREQTDDDDTPNDTALRTMISNSQTQVRGRSYRSQASLLGIPVIDVQVGDPMMDPNEKRTPQQAFGWIAIGDRATGILFACGGVARGFIAVGGAAMGVVSIGGLALGVVALGGVSLGVISGGGLGLGCLAFGGLAIGWQAAGGGAIAWKCAVGGGAIAYEAAMGGGAIARHYAVGAAAAAEHVNDDTAKQFMDGQLPKRVLDFFIANRTLMTIAIIFLSVAPTCIRPVMYRREPTAKSG